MNPDLSKLNFWSGANYMKRIADDTPYTDVVIAAFGTTTLPVAHGLGFIPEYDVQVEIFNDGRIWNAPLPYQGMSAGFGASSVYWDAWVSTSDLTITLRNPTGSSKTVRVYHIIYKDYA